MTSTSLLSAIIDEAALVFVGWQTVPRPHCSHRKCAVADNWPTDLRHQCRGVHAQNVLH